MNLQVIYTHLQKAFCSFYYFIFKLAGQGELLVSEMMVKTLSSIKIIELLNNVDFLVWIVWTIQTIFFDFSGHFFETFFENLFDNYFTFFLVIF